MTWLPLLSSLVKSIADGWGSTQRYKRSQKAKEAGMANLKLFIMEELKDTLHEIDSLPLSKQQRVLKQIDKAWDRFDEDSIIKG